MGKENIICGKRIIKEALKGNVTIETLYISKNVNLKSIEDIVLYAKKNNVEVKFVYGKDIDNICENKVNQGIAAKIKDYKYYKFEECLKELEKEEKPFILILDSIQDPQNLGAILRSAECIGVKNVIIPQKKSAKINSTVWKASAGAIAHLNICRANNLLDIILKLKEKSFKVVATDVNSIGDLGDQEYNFPVALILGNEDQGVNENLLEQCDVKITIPMYGNISSFNVSVAAGIIMYEIKNKQRRLMC